MGYKVDCSDLLLAEGLDGKLSVVEAPAHIADVGGIVLFNGGKVGRIRQRAYRFGDDPMAWLLKAVAPVFPAEAIYSLDWKVPEKDGQSVDTPVETEDGGRPVVAPTERDADNE